MAYTVLARRYRPMTFDEVVGQEPIARTLKSALSQNRVAHAYLFCGTRGVGKTTMARILARALNCEKGPTPDPCGKCDICQAIHRGDDIDVLEIDGASNTSVEDVRVLRDNAHYRPARARYKIYYIDEVHMLSRSAFNALLKTLEEPPEHVIFLFSTTEPERLPATILSRCQRFDFRAVATERIAEHLVSICKQEKVKAEPAAVTAIARQGRGSVRDALTLLDQVIAVGDGKVTLEAVRETVGAVGGDKVLAVIAACAEGQAGRALGLFGELLAGGVDLQALLDQFMRHVRDLLVVKTCGTEAEVLDAFGPDPKAMAEVVGKLSVPALVAALGYLTEARSRLRGVVDGRPIAELALVRTALLAEMEPLSDVLAHLEQLERSLAGSSGPGRAPPPSVAGRGGAVAAAAPARVAAPPPDEKKKNVAPAAPVRPAPTRAVPEAVAEPESEPQQAPEPEPVAESPQASSPPRKQRDPSEVLKDPLIQKTVKMFGGRVVSADE